VSKFIRPYIFFHFQFHEDSYFVVLNYQDTKLQIKRPVFVRLDSKMLGVHVVFFSFYTIKMPKMLSNYYDYKIDIE